MFDGVLVLSILHGVEAVLQQGKLVHGVLGLHIRRLDGVLEPVVIEQVLLPVGDQVARMRHLEPLFLRGHRGATIPTHFKRPTLRPNGNFQRVPICQQQKRHAMMQRRIPIQMITMPFPIRNASKKHSPRC